MPARPPSPATALVPAVRVAVIDLYDGTPNEGMRAIRELLTASDGACCGVPIEHHVFETRSKDEVPGLDHDVYISSGGPGSPFDGEGKRWEKRYFELVDSIVGHNARGEGSPKHVFFICHSFQLMARFFGIASVVPRKSASFGVFPVYPTPEGRRDILFRGLGDPFYGADFRQWQVVQPRKETLRTLGATVLALEKKRPHIPLERAIMAIRISPWLVGTQFHPEADPSGMSRHFRSRERRESVISQVGIEKYERIIHRLEDPGFLRRTHDAVLPRFIRQAVAAVRPDVVAAGSP